MAAVTNHHKCGGLKHHRLFSVAQKSDMSNWAKIKVLDGSVFLLEALGDPLYHYFFQLLEVAHIPWLVAPSSTSKPAVLATSDLSLSLTLLPPSKDLVVAIELTTD